MDECLKTKKRVIWKKEISVDYVFTIGMDLNRTHDRQEMKSINGVNPPPLDLILNKI